MAGEGGGGGWGSKIVGTIVILAILNLLSWMFNWPIWFW
jgi:hypothetical protein